MSPRSTGFHQTVRKHLIIRDDWVCLPSLMPRISSSSIYEISSFPSFRAAIDLFFSEWISRIDLRLLAIDGLEGDVEDQGRVRRDEAGETAGTVGVVASDRESGLLAESHAAVSGEDTLVPALDDLTDTDLGVEVSASDGAVKLLALLVVLGGVLEVTGVLHGDAVTGLGLGDAVAGGGVGLGDTHSEGCEGEESGRWWSGD